MRLDFHHRDPAIADVDGAGVLFAEIGQDALILGGEVMEQRTRVLVAAMFAPQRAEHTQLDVARRAAQHVAGAFVLIAAQGNLCQDIVVHLGRPRVAGRRIARHVSPSAR